MVLVSPGVLTAGAAIETGTGRYSLHYDAGSADSLVSKHGHVSYIGGAVFAELMTESGWHGDLTLRGGYVRSTQDGALFDTATLTSHDIKLGIPYAGFEFGAGKLISLSDSLELDLYGRWLFLWQDSAAYTAGVRYSLDPLLSQRLRLGTELKYSLINSLSLYGGMAFEYEFDGKATATVSTASLRADVSPAKTDGTRLLLEAGLTASPDSQNRLQIRGGLKGTAGQDYRSLHAMIEVRYLF